MWPCAQAWAAFMKGPVLIARVFVWSRIGVRRNMCILWFLVHSGPIESSAVTLVSESISCARLADFCITYVACPKNSKTMSLQLGTSKMHAE